MLLYRYRSLDQTSRKNTMNIIKEQSLYFATPDQFNDPFECRAAIELSSSKKEFSEYLRDITRRQAPGLNRSARRNLESKMRRENRQEASSEKVAKAVEDEYRELAGKCGILCLSEDYANILMWAHYAKDHTGVCFGFDGSESNPFFGRSLRVEYSNDYPIINLVKEDRQSYYIKCLLTKSYDWHYEKEWRIVEHKNGKGVYKFHKDDLKEVRFGINTDTQDIQDVRNSCIEAGMTPKFYKAIRGQREFKLNFIEI